MTLFEQLGSLTTVKLLANAFYDVMDKDPDFKTLRALHPEKLTTTKKKLFIFLSHWLGGPELLKQTPPSVVMLELRHRHFELSEQQAQLWLACMDKAMAHINLTPNLQTQLHAAFSAMIKAMQHQRTLINKKS